MRARSGLVGLVLIFGCLLPAPPAVMAAPSEEARGVVPTHLPYPRNGSATFRAGLQPANDGSQLTENIPAKVRRSWVASPPTDRCSKQNQSEYETPVTITQGKYTVVLHDGRCALVTAYRTKTGKRLWQKRLFSWATMVSDGKSVFVVDHSIPRDDWHVSAYKISSGRRLWWSSHTGQTLDLSAGNGVVVNGDVVLDARTGKQRSSLPYSTADVGNAHTLVVDKVVYRNDERTVEAFSLDGQLLWRHARPLDDPGWRPAYPQHHGGRIYVTSTSTQRSPTLVLDAATGDQLGDLPTSAHPLAMDGPVGIFSTPGIATLPDGSATASGVVVSAVDLRDGHVYWRHEYLGRTGGPGSGWLETAPVVENGLVWFVLDEAGQSASALVALDEVSGQTRSAAPLTCTLRNHSADDISGSIGVAQHRLFVPGPCGLQTYVAKKG